MLPKITQPTYDLKLPSDNSKITFRAYSVKEERILMIAAEGKDEKEIAAATRQIVNNVVVAPANFDCLDLPTFDVDYIFMNARAKSVGDKVEQDFTCNNPKPSAGKQDSEICGQKFKMIFNLGDVKIVDNKADKKIFFSKDFGVIMKYPSYKTTLGLTEEDSEFETTQKTIYGSIDCIFDATQTYPMKEQSYAEFTEFMDSLTTDQYNKIKDFIDKMPSFYIEKEHVCEKCGFVHKVRYDDPVNFF